MRPVSTLLLLVSALVLGLLLRLGMAQGGGEGAEEGEGEGEPALPGFEAFGLEQLRERAREDGRAYLGFLDRPTLSSGIYRLPAGGPDRQGPHDEDEVYYVIAGRGSFRAGDETRQVEPGDTLFVGAFVEHRFFEIEEDLELLVFFSKAEVKR